jgi:hypothetical protein
MITSSFAVYVHELIKSYTVAEIRTEDLLFFVQPSTSIERSSDLKSMEELSVNNGNGQGSILLNFISAESWSDFHRQILDKFLRTNTRNLN